MKFISYGTFLIVVMVCTTSTFGKKPRNNKPPKPPKPALSQEQKQAIVSSVAQVMGGICTLIENPHNPHNVGNSVTTMFDGFVKIAIAKMSNKKVAINDIHAIKKYLNQLCQDISREITEIIITKKLLIIDNA